MCYFSGLVTSQIPYKAGNRKIQSTTDKVVNNERHTISKANDAVPGEKYYTAAWTDAQIVDWDAAEFETFVTSDKKTLLIQPTLLNQPAVQDLPQPAATEVTIIDGTRTHDRLVTIRLGALESIVNRLYALVDNYIKNSPKFDLTQVDWKSLCVVLNKVAQR